MPDRDKSSAQTVVLTDAPHFRAEARSNRLLVTSETNDHVLDGEVYVAIAEALWQSNSGGVSWEELRDKLTLRYQLKEILAALTVLAEIGYVHPVQPQSDDIGFASWLHSVGRERREYFVHVETICSTGEAALEEMLHFGGFQRSRNAGVTVVLTDDYLNPELKRVNGEAERPWLLTKLVGHTIWLGPLFTPGQSPCWECLAWWLRMHRWQSWGFLGGGECHPARPSVAHWPATVAIGAGMLMTALLGTELRDCLITFDTRTLAQWRHPVRAVSGCATCNAKASATPSDLWTFVSSVTGIVEQLEVSSGAEAGLFHARAHFVHALPAAPVPKIMRPGESFGKGANADEAAIRCTAEAIERYSVAWRGSEAITRARASEIDGISVNDLGQYSDRQFFERLGQAATEGLAGWVPHRLPEDLRIGWAECRALDGSAHRYAPAAAVYYGYPFETAQRYFVPDSNGCAAGRTYDEALAGALAELVERDSFAIWWYNRVRRPGIRLREDELDDVTFGILEGLRTDGRSVSVLDVTTDFAIPAFVALAPKNDGSDVVFGAAANVCPRRAIEKALAEVSQITYWKDRIVADPELASWFRTANSFASGFEWLLALGELDLPARRRIPAAAAVEECASKIQNAGISCYCVDLTRPETGVPVVRAIAPGLRHPWRRFAPGRLYDVPVALGWLKEPLAEAALNPIACMI